MFTGKSPGELGVYGFKHRRGHAMTHPIELVSRLDYQAKPVWEWASRQGLESVVVGVPSTWPIASLRGAMLSDFTTPPHQRAVYPDAYRRLLPEDWSWDLSDWRNQPREKILDDLIALSRRYWTVFRRMLAENPNWALSILVDIGMDRAHHLFWEDAIDAGAAPKNGGPLWKFYKFIDEEIGKFLTTLDDDISLLIVSDHGAQAMKGSFALNQWLLQEGLLSLKDEKWCNSGTRRRLGKECLVGRRWVRGQTPYKSICVYEPRDTRRETSRTSAGARPGWNGQAHGTI